MPRFFVCREVRYFLIGFIETKGETAIEKKKTTLRQSFFMLCYQKRRKTPSFSYGDIRRVQRPLRKYWELDFLIYSCNAYNFLLYFRYGKNNL